MNLLKVEGTEHKEKLYVDPKSIMWLYGYKPSRVESTNPWNSLLSYTKSKNHPEWLSTSSIFQDFYFKYISLCQFLPG